MKKLTYIAAFLAASMAAYAQGTINLNNRVSGSVDAPVFDVGGTVKLAGTGFWAQLYAGPTAGALAAIAPAVNFRTGTAAGYIVTPGEVQIGTVAPGQKAQLALRAWAGAAGSTYETASIKGSSTVFESLALGGSVGGAPPTPGPALIGLTSFSLVPEPSTIALGALGVAALLFRRRK